jgi:ADP-heptose:LPS heptosyltransferase
MNKYDVLFLSKKAIGNTLEMLYAVEYCLHNDIKAAIYIDEPNQSFLHYLEDCYGKDVILSTIDGLSVKNLIHTFLIDEKLKINYENYFYINPDKLSTQYKTETEQYLSIVKALYPSKYDSNILTYLKDKETKRIQSLNIRDKYIIYPGCSSFAAIRRWPHYMELIKKLGCQNTVILGGKDDLVDDYAYIYPKWLTYIMPLKVTNRKSFWQFCKKMHILLPYAHNQKFETMKCSFFNQFDWYELAYIFRHSKAFIANDGGLMHFASSVGGRGVAIFGPTSVEKSKSYNKNVHEIHTNYACQPCHFGVKDVYIGNYFIPCPYQVKCLKDIDVEAILESLKRVESE